MTRRSLLRATFSVAVAATTLATATAATAAPTAGSATVPAWTWTTLPGAGGLQVSCTDASGRTGTVPVSWTADGTVTATYSLPLTVTAPGSTGQRVTMAAGYGLAVRRAGA